MIRKLLLGAVLLAGSAAAWGAADIVQNAPVTFDSNYFFRASGKIGLCPTKTITSGTSASLALGECALVWKSPAAGTKATAIPGCAPAINGVVLRVIDGQRSAAADWIVVTPAAGTVYGDTTLTMGANGIAVALRCVGASSEWVIDG